MDNNIAIDMPALMAQIADLKAHGESVDRAELIMTNVLNGVQLIFDEKLEGHYYSVRREQDDLVVYDFINQPTGKLTNAQFDFVVAFENQAPFLWDMLEREVIKILGR